jgi:peroxiredoxin
MSTFSKIIALLVCTLALTVSFTRAADFVPAVKHGDPLPIATVRTEKGETLSLRAVAAKPTVLIFYRGGWCPYCNSHLAALAGIEAELLAAGYHLVALSPDRPEKIRAKPEQQKLNYRLLSDSAMEASKALGIAHQLDADTVVKYKGYGIDLEASSGEKHHLLPHPAVFVVGADGLIRFAHVGTDYKVRLEPEKILAAARDAK